MEDAAVLADELATYDGFKTALSHFMTRRPERAKMVVNNSLDLGRLAMAGAPMLELGALMQASTNTIFAACKWQQCGTKLPSRVM